MMNHDEVKEKLFDLYDRPLTERERRLVESHLPECSECRHVLQQWQKITRALFPAPAFSEAQEDLFVSKVMARVAAVRSTNRILSWDFVFRWLMPLVGSTIAAAWVFLSVLPQTPGLYADSNNTVFLSDNNAGLAPASWSVLPVADSNEEMVVSYLK